MNVIVTHLASCNINIVMLHCSNCFRSSPHRLLPAPDTKASLCAHQVSLHGFLGFSVPTSEPQTYPLTFPQPDWPVKADPSFIGPFYSKCVMGQVGGEEEDTRRPGVYYRSVENTLHPGALNAGN